MEIAINTPLAAFVAGLLTSIHCSLMCGPLGCALLASPDTTPRQLHTAIALYHGARALAYTLIGGLLGAFGIAFARLFDGRPAQLLPWMIALLFLLLAVGAERWVPQPRFLSNLLLRIRFRAGANRNRSALALGALTPFIPCGPLYLIFGVALFAGSFLAGAALTFSFALGTLPLYWLAQSQLLRLRFSPATWVHLRRGLAGVAALIIAWRAAAITGTGSALLDGILCH